MSGDVASEIVAIFRANIREEDHELDDTMNRVITLHGWPPVREAIFTMLESGEADLCPTAMAALWGAVLDKRDMNPNRAIALVYSRLLLDEHGDDNLAWSIACNLKRVDYLSDYDPLTDPDVVSEMQKLPAR